MKVRLSIPPRKLWLVCVNDSHLPNGGDRGYQWETTAYSSKSAGSSVRDSNCMLGTSSPLSIPRSRGPPRLGPQESLASRSNPGRAIHLRKPAVLTRTMAYEHAHRRRFGALTNSRRAFGSSGVRLELLTHAAALARRWSRWLGDWKPFQTVYGFVSASAHRAEASV